MPETPTNPLEMLGHAVWASGLGAVVALLERGAPVDSWGGPGDLRGVTPLMEAVDEIEGFFDQLRTDILNRLLATGADITRRDNAGRTALHYASVAGSAATKILIAAGADPDAPDREGRTPLHEAVDRGCVATVVALCSANADASITDASGRTALDYIDDGYSVEERALVLPLLMT